MRTKDCSRDAGVAMLLLMLCTLPMLSGCTVLGFGAGWIADSGNEYFEDVPLSSGLRELDTGDTVICVTKPGTIVAGTYAGMGAAGEDVHVERATFLRVLTGEQVEEIDTATIHALRIERTPWTWRTALTYLGLMLDAVVAISFVTGFEI